MAQASSNLSPDLLPTRIACNAAARASLTRRVNAGRLTPRQASPQLLRLLAEAEELRAAAVQLKMSQKSWRRPLVRPPWLVEEG